MNVVAYCTILYHIVPIYLKLQLILASVKYFRNFLCRPPYSYSFLSYQTSALSISARFNSYVALCIFPVPDNGPATIKVSVVSSSVANVTWTPVPPELRNGVILGYFVSYDQSMQPICLFEIHSLVLSKIEGKISLGMGHATPPHSAMTQDFRIVFL